MSALYPPHVADLLPHQEPRHMLHFYKNGSTSDVDQLIDTFSELGRTCAFLFGTLYLGSMLFFFLHQQPGRQHRLWMLWRKLNSWLTTSWHNKPIPKDTKGRQAAGCKEESGGSGGTKRELVDHGIKHLAVIMDGNRRYGKAANVPQSAAEGEDPSAKSTEETRKDPSLLAKMLKASPAALYGHKKGGDKLLDFIDWCIQLRIPILTVYAFSTENWSRPKAEVDYLMSLFVSYFKKILSVSKEKGIVIRFVSTDPELLPNDILELMYTVEETTASYVSTGACQITVNVCVSYGSRSELVGACQRAADGGEGNELSEASIEREMLKSITEMYSSATDAVGRKVTKISKRCHDHPARIAAGWTVNPDLILRTSGEQRLSNFLLYQAAYSELFFVPITWPEVGLRDLEDVVTQYCSRTRRFGK